MYYKELIKDKIKGALYGFSLGDSMGSTTEFMSDFEIEEKYGKVCDLIGGGWLNLKAGECTDDTQMSICIMNVLMKKNFSDLENIDTNIFKKEIVCEFLKWFDTNPKDIGNQCKRALTYYKKTSNYIQKDDTALGNGSLMRSLPIALLNTENSYKLNISQGQITHNNNICDSFIEEYTKIIKNIIFSKNITLEKRTLLKPSGYIVNTFNNAIYFASLENFASCILGAVNHGGDSDTIAAIACSISGLIYGFSSIDKNLVDKLSQDVKDVLDKFLEFVLKTY